MVSRRAFIFDIDGVLVDPKGYRAAVRATQAYFTHAIELDDGVLVDDDIYALFEACRVTSEWDMVPLALAILLEKILEAHPELNRVNDLETCMQAIRRIPADRLPNEIDYRTTILAFSKYLNPQNFPAYQVLKLAQSIRSNVEQSSESGLPIFPILAQTPILEILLAHTRDIYRSPTTRLFQQFSLGSQAFEQTYGLVSEVETPSFLLEYDQPLISQNMGQRLAQLNRSGDLALCAYTMRPSLPPNEARVEIRGYSPEAEMALQLVNLTDIPMIGYGRIHYLAQQVGWPAEKLLKPSPVQAIAAILAAASRDELSALYTALKVYQGITEALDSLPPGDEIIVSIFEDSAGGIEAMQLAGDLLTRAGMKIQIHAYGISNHPEKRATLQRYQIPIFQSTEEAVKVALA
jgi:hypothetical protein